MALDVPGRGLPAIVLVFVSAWYLPKRPADASWLNADERALIGPVADVATPAGEIGYWRSSIAAKSMVWLCTGL